MTAPAVSSDFKASSEPALDGPKAFLLRLALEAGVPLRILEYRRDRRSAQWLQERARWAAQQVAAHGDILQYPTRAHTSGGVRAEPAALGDLGERP